MIKNMRDYSLNELRMINEAYVSMLINESLGKRTRDEWVNALVKSNSYSVTKGVDFNNMKPLIAEYEHTTGKKALAEDGKSASDEFMLFLRRKSAEKLVDAIFTLPLLKEQKAAFFWLMKDTIRIPEDLPKVHDAIELGEKAKGNKKNTNSTDFAAYQNPNSMIEALCNVVNLKQPPINPDTVKELTGKEYYPYGVTTYYVQDDRAGQQAMRNIINTHWGEDANPWCLLHGDGHGNLSDGSNGTYDAWHYWNVYDALPKKVAFKDGKLLAFMATERNPYDEHFVLEYDDAPEELKEKYDEFEDALYDKYEYPRETNEWMDFDRWVKQNYEDWYADREMEFYDNAPEQWWDRNDSSHDGIPLGNVEIKGDKYGRWGEAEISTDDGKVLFGKYSKGKDTDDRNDYITWYSSGPIEVIRFANRKGFIRFHENGRVGSFKDVKDNLVYSFRDDGTLLNITKPSYPHDSFITFDNDGDILKWGDTIGHMVRGFNPSDNPLERYLTDERDYLLSKVDEGKRIYSELSEKYASNVQGLEEYSDYLNGVENKTKN